MAASSSALVVEGPPLDKATQDALVALIVRGWSTLHGFRAEITGFMGQIDATSGEIIHKLQYDINKGHLVLAWLNYYAADPLDVDDWQALPWAQMERDLRERTGLGDAIVIDDYIGRHSLRLRLSQYAHVERVLDTAMQMWPRCCFSLCTRLEPMYRPGTRVSVEESEAIFLARMQAAPIETERFLVSYDNAGPLLCNDRLWRTEAGKLWASGMRDRHRIRIDIIPSELPSPPLDPLARLASPLGERFDWPIPLIEAPASAAPPAAAAGPAPMPSLPPDAVPVYTKPHAMHSLTSKKRHADGTILIDDDDSDAASVPSSSPKRAMTVANNNNNNDDGDEDGMCLVCASVPPDTVPQPCGCCVLCAQCSRSLQGTPNAQTCLRCQRALTSVVYMSELK